MLDPLIMIMVTIKSLSLPILCSSVVGSSNVVSSLNYVQFALHLSMSSRLISTCYVLGFSKPNTKATKSSYKETCLNDSLACLPLKYKSIITI